MLVKDEGHVSYQDSHKAGQKEDEEDANAVEVHHGAGRFLTTDPRVDFCVHQKASAGRWDMLVFALPLSLASRPAHHSVL